VVLMPSEVLVIPYPARPLFGRVPCPVPQICT
jgi:hypothetical protein